VALLTEMIEILISTLDIMQDKPSPFGLEINLLEKDQNPNNSGTHQQDEVTGISVDIAELPTSEVCWP